MLNEAFFCLLKYIWSILSIILEKLESRLIKRAYLFFIMSKKCMAVFLSESSQAEMMKNAICIGADGMLESILELQDEERDKEVSLLSFNN